VYLLVKKPINSTRNHKTELSCSESARSEGRRERGEERKREREEALSGSVRLFFFF